MNISRTRAAALTAFALLAGCARPTDDQSDLKAIKAESQALMTRIADTDAVVPRSRWPRVIASLNPKGVTVHQDGVDIMIKPYFDGGWGYFVPKDGRKAPQPEGRYSMLGHGVYWYHPY